MCSRRGEIKYHVEGDAVVIEEAVFIGAGDVFVIEGVGTGEEEVYILRSARVDQGSSEFCADEAIVRWIVENVDEKVVPPDAGNGDALVYNLVHLVRDGKDYRSYFYEPGQDEEIALRFGVSE